MIAPQNGVAMEVLCRQPAQKYGSRCCVAGSLRVKPSAVRHSTSQARSPAPIRSAPSTLPIRAAITLAIAVGVSSPFGDSRMPSCGTCTYSPDSSY